MLPDVNDSSKHSVANAGDDAVSHGDIKPSKGTDCNLERGETEEITINKKFAERYQTSKRKQLLSSVPAGVLDESSASDSSSEEEEDELAEQLTKGIDRRVRETLEAIRNKDPSIYDKNTRFFDDKNEEGTEQKEHDQQHSDSDDNATYDSEDEPVAGWETVAKSAQADIAKLTLKDYVRETLLKDGKLSDSEEDDDDNDWRPLSQDSDGEEESALAEGAANAITGANGSRAETENVRDDGLDSGKSDDEDFFKKKDKTAAEIEAEEQDFEQFLHKQAKKRSQKAGEELLLHSYLENEKPDEKERFLRDFVLNNGWLDNNAAEAPSAGDYEIEIDQNDPNEERDIEPEAGDDEFEDKVDEFEAKYNFRFEDPDGAQVVSHARKVADSMRRPDDRRKRARQARRLRKQQEKLAKTEEIKHLKNLKKSEVEARLLAIQEAAGDGIDVSGIDLDRDFDPDEFNKQMESRFGDDYYAQDDEDMKQLTKDGVAVASEKRLPARSTKDVSEDLRSDVNRLMDEYYNLDYEDIVGGVPMRFDYKKVEPESFNMTQEEILGMEDKELNRIVSMKYLAPYRANRDVKKQSWRVHDALKKQRRARKQKDATIEEPSALQALAKEREGNDTRRNGSMPRGHRTESRKRRRQRESPDGEDDGGKHSIDAEEGRQLEANLSLERENEEQQKSSKKRKRKKRSPAETVEQLSSSRKEAYSIG